MLTYFLDRSADKPLYEQLYEGIKQAIQDNRLKMDDPLPSKRRLARHLDISVTTVESAYVQLETEGYIKARPRIGFFVATDLDLPNTSSRPAVKRTDAPGHARNWLVDFQTDHIDPETFPHVTYAKIARNTILDDYASHLDRGHPQGSDALRKNIADLLYRYRGFTTSADNIWIGSGSEQLLSLLTLLLGKNRSVAIENPCYPKNHRLYEAYGMDVIPIPMDQKGMDTGQLSSSGASIVHVTPSHQYPTGIVTPINRRLELLRWASHADERIIIEDDYDSEFRFYGSPIPAMKGMDELGNVIYMNSFSKMLAPGFRIAYMVLPDRLLGRINDLQSFYGSGVPTFQQMILSRFIASGEFEKHLRKTKKRYRHKRDTLIDLLRHASFAHHMSIHGEEAGLHFLMHLDTTIPEGKLVRAARDHGINIRGMHEYIIGENHRAEQSNQLVFGYARPKYSEMENGVRLLEDAWKEIGLT